MIRISLVCLALLVSGTSMAAPQINVVCTDKAHTMHTVSVNKPARCVVSKSFEPQNFCLVDDQERNTDGQELVVMPGQPMSFGMALTPTADFNLEYTLTCVASDGKLAQSPKVVFTIGADGPGQPHVAITTLYGGHGSWQNSAHGGDFSITF